MEAVATLPRLATAPTEDSIFSDSTLALFEHRRNHWENLIPADRTAIHKQIKESRRQDYMQRLESVIEAIEQAFATKFLESRITPSPKIF